MAPQLEPVANAADESGIRDWQAGQRPDQKIARLDALKGEGRFVDVSMCEGSMAMALYGLTSHFGGLALPAGAGMLMGGLAPYGTYATKDGGAVALGALEPKFWKAFCRAAEIECGMEALVPGPHQTEWKKKIADAIAGKTRDEWAAIGAEADCCLERR